MGAGQSSQSSDDTANLVVLTDSHDLAHDDDILIWQLNGRALELLGNFDTAGHLPDVIEAASLLRTAIELTPEGHEHMHSLLDTLGSALEYQFQHTGELALIDESISFLQRAVRFTPEGDKEVPVRLTHLSQSLIARFLHKGDLDDILEVEPLMHRAMVRTQDDDPRLPLRYALFGTYFLHYFKRTGNKFHIDEAVLYLKRALARLEEDHRERPTVLDNLGVAYSSPFEVTGDLSDISNAISAQQRALSATPPGDGLATRLGNTGCSLILRYVRTADLSDLTEAISALERSILLTPERHAELPLRLCNLAVSLRYRYAIMKDPRDINEAVTSGRKAVELTPDGHAEMPTRLSAHGAALRVRFDDYGDISDMDEAITAIKAATKLVPEDDAVLRVQFNNLGTTFHSRFLRTREDADIDDAISLQERAVDETPGGHADLPVQLSTLARFLYDRACFAGTIQDLEESIQRYHEATFAGVGSPGVRLQAAMSWSSILALHYPESPAILEAFDAVVELVTMAAGLEQTVQRRLTELRRLPDVTPQAAASACSFQRPAKALEWLEQGRCLVWNQLNQLRTPLDELSAHDPRLAQKILRVSEQLEGTSASQRPTDMDMSLSQKLAMEQANTAHLDLVKEWEQLVEWVRCIPELETFLRPVRCSSLMQHLPSEGPIIVVNVGLHRCDALALIAGLDQPLHIPLPSFTLEKGTEYRQILSNQLALHGMRDAGEKSGEGATPEGLTGDEQAERDLGRYRRRRAADSNDVTRRVLGQLWVEVVKPILDALGFSRTDTMSGNKPPRIWWCPTGVLSFLPIHAAGVYGGAQSETVMDYAVSSYTPIVSAITSRVKNAQPIDESVSGLFLTSQPDAIPFSLIPGTTKEVRGISAKAERKSVRALKVEGDDITVEQCLDYLEEFSSVHFACHASQNASEPLSSRFFFHNGHLDLASIVQKNLKHADLSYLSACQTGTGDEALSNEAVHLAAGMLAAGYRRVVATMWSVGDEAAQDVSNDFYDYLWSDETNSGGHGIDGSLSAYALHHATEQLRNRRDSCCASLLTWVPFVHFGY